MEKAVCFYRHNLGFTLKIVPKYKSCNNFSIFCRMLRQFIFYWWTHFCRVTYPKLNLRPQFSGLLLRHCTPSPLIYSPIRVKTAWIEPTPAKRPNDKKRTMDICLLVLSQELKGNCQPDKHSFISKSIIIENDMDNNKRIIYLFLIKKRVSNIFLYNNDSLGYH